jgi:hypothetical protein
MNCEKCDAIETLTFTVPGKADIYVQINWKRIYDFLKERPDISFEGFLHSMASISEAEDDFVQLFGDEQSDRKNGDV